MLSKKSKIEQFAKSRKNPFLVAAAPASPGRTSTKLCGRFFMTRCGPSPWRASDAPAALENLVHLPENTFSTASARCRSLCSRLVFPFVGEHRKLAAPATQLGPRGRRRERFVSYNPLRVTFSVGGLTVRRGDAPAGFAERNFPAITPLGGICTWKSGAAPSRFCPETRPELGFPVFQTLRRVSTLM
jgi:hypothetical protein